jgi:NTE family protein
LSRPRVTCCFLTIGLEPSDRGARRGRAPKKASLPGQVVLVLQGGGALGAFQLGAYQALHEAGIDPHWVVGTSIGAINGALIAGNPPEARLDRLHEFWDRMERPGAELLGGLVPMVGNMLAAVRTIFGGIPGFFELNPAVFLGPHAPVGIDQASYYCTDALRKTLAALVDFDYLRSKATRLTVGAVNARTGAMRYFDSRAEDLQVDHVMASGALPPAFPAVRIGGEPYWDGGIYSNTPTEVVFDDNPRRDSVIFAVHLWNPRGGEPRSLWEVSGRQKDIQYASRAYSHILKQQQIHKLRHVIRQVVLRVPENMRSKPDVSELAAWGCGTTMHVVRLMAPRLEHEDHTKDIDFSSKGIHARWQAGHASAQRAIAAEPWLASVDPRDGVVIHEFA